MMVSCRSSPRWPSFSSAARRDARARRRSGSGGGKPADGIGVARPVSGRVPASRRRRPGDGGEPGVGGLVVDDRGGLSRSRVARRGGGGRARGLRDAHAAGGRAGHARPRRLPSGSRPRRAEGRPRRAEGRPRRAEGRPRRAEGQQPRRTVEQMVVAAGAGRRHGVRRRARGRPGYGVRGRARGWPGSGHPGNRNDDRSRIGRHSPGLPGWPDPGVGRGPLPRTGSCPAPECRRRA